MQYVDYDIMLLRRRKIREPNSNCSREGILMRERLRVEDMLMFESGQEEICYHDIIIL